MRIRIAATRSDRDAWDQYVDSLTGVPPLYFVWADILHESYGVSPNFFLAEDACGITGMCPTYVVQSGAGRKSLYTLKFGLQGANDYVKEQLLNAVHNFCMHHHVAYSSITSGMIPLRSFSVGGIMSGVGTTVKKTLLCDLFSDETTVWAALRNKTRNMIRKAQRAGLSVESGAQHLDAFYDVYSIRMIEKRIPIHARIFFAKMLHYLGDHAELLVALRYGEVIAGMVLLYGCRYAVYPYQACRSGFEQYAPNQLLIWEAMKRCTTRGIPLLDMGESMEGSPVYQSKINFGGRPEDVYYYTMTTTMNKQGKSGFFDRVDSFYRKSLAFSANKFFLHAPFIVKKRIGVWLKRQGRII